MHVISFPYLATYKLIIDNNYKIFYIYGMDKILKKWYNICMKI